MIKARLLWDHGGLWSLMAWEALASAGLAVFPTSAEEIKTGCLEGCSLLMAPGGWPSLKFKALGKTGCTAVRQFIQDGGNYLGLCGGAGLALDVEQGLALLPVSRYSGPKRLTSLSGPVKVDFSLDALSLPFLEGIRPEEPFHVWWPGQFQEIMDAPPGLVQVLGRYQGPAPGLYSSDLNPSQISQGDWTALEAEYGIKLNPSAMSGLPCLVWGENGRGRVLLSYLHFDTPGDENGRRVLRGLWKQWTGLSPKAGRSLPKEPGPTGRLIARNALAIWDEGRRLNLWRPRHIAMPLWQRGARGLEFWSLVRMSRAVAALSSGMDDAEQFLKPCQEALAPIWQNGKEALALHRRVLDGKPEEPPRGQPLSDWFPKPRRTGGDWLYAMGILDNTLFRILRRLK